jgi:flagellar basal-body rod protein FlgF
MIYGLYLSAQGAEAQAFRQAVLANNLANAQTTAFKPDVPLFRAHFPFDVVQQTTAIVPDTLEQQTGGVDLAATVTDHSQGPLTVTHGALDVAVVGPGFLQAHDGQETLLTRNGRLALNHLRQLVTADAGHPLLNTDGAPLTIPVEASDVEIGPDGTVLGTTADGARLLVGRLALVEPAESAGLMKRGASYYAVQGEIVPAAQAELRQGVLEDSLVHPVSAMVELIETARTFEMNMSMLRLQDEMAGQLLRTMPRR